MNTETTQTPEPIATIDDAPTAAETPKTSNLPTLAVWQFSTFFVPFFERLDDDEQRGIMLRALYVYAFAGKETPISNPKTHAVYFFAMKEIDKQRKRVAELSIARSHAGKAGIQALNKKRADAERRKAKRLAAKLAEQGTITTPETTSETPQS